MSTGGLRTRPTLPWSHDLDRRPTVLAGRLVAQSPIIADVALVAGGVPFAADDLPGCALRLYDDYVAGPALMRLVLWKRLEREPLGCLIYGQRRGARARGVERQRLGTVRDDVDAADR